jgi:hypothetical protein
MLEPSVSLALHNSNTTSNKTGINKDEIQTEANTSSTQKDTSKVKLFFNFDLNASTINYTPFLLLFLVLRSIL